MADTTHKVPVLVVGGGPVGLLTAWQLAEQGIECMLAERNPTTTLWPKMDITNCRSMELLSRMSLATTLREAGVPPDVPLDVLFSTGLGSQGELLTKWHLPSPNDLRTRIRDINDGSMPRESYQRCSQAIFEASLKPYLDSHPCIQTRFGLKLESLKEKADRVISILINSASGQRIVIESLYVVGCDGAGSTVRKTAGIELSGNPMTNKPSLHLVHFKSRDFSKIHSQGQFWHIFLTNGAIVISQDDDDTWTIHIPVSPEAEGNTSNVDPKNLVYQALGGSTLPFEIEIDEILLYNTWSPGLCVADAYTTSNGRIFLAGDSAHLNIPTGGYGMNTSVGDAFDIGWKLAAVLNGYGGSHLLKSYEIERRPVAVRNVERSGVHASIHFQCAVWTAEKGPSIFLSNSDEAGKLKSKITDFVLEHDGENKDHGIEMDYRFPYSPVIVNDNDIPDDIAWTPRNYVPSTAPGSRAPHIFLHDGKTSIFDLYGKEFSIIDFTEAGELSLIFMDAAAEFGIPLARVHVPNETHAQQIWKCEAALIRPDGFVAWRAKNQVAIQTVSKEEIKVVLQTVTGRHV